ncbi:Six-hairpin glycosidase [Acephala macrosclerotiorum]|nr:Six-hairpin glycosidase [Acephala macrosclerotiorum]
MIYNSPTSYYVLPSVILLGLGLSNLVEAIAGHEVNARSQTSYTPVAFAVGTAPIIDGLQPLSAKAVTLDSSAPVLTLDYGADVAGFPYFEVTSLAGPAAQIELKYSEQFEGLNLNTGDGPWLYANGLMNSFRTETFNITTTGTTGSFFIQGGQRWQTITLLSNTSVTVSNVGFKASVDIQPVDNLIGKFSSSNDVYDGLWGLGARAVQASCVEANSQPSTWEISEDGAFIRGQYPGTSAKGFSYGDYTMSFSTKITRGGTGWRVAAGPNAGYGAYFVLTSDSPQLLSTDTTVVKPNSVIASYGFSIVNFYLSSAPPLYYSNPFPISENEWYRVSTTITPSGYNVSVNGTQFAFVPYTTFLPYVNEGFGGTNLVTTGSWGFGPFMDQAAYIKDVEVVAQDSTVLYTNSLTSTDILEEYLVASNAYAVCLDGAKRDREIWIGDFVHTARELAASTGRYDFIQSMISFEFLNQFTSGPAAGIVPIQDSMGSGPQYQSVYYPSQYSETDYQLFFLLTLGDYFALTSDTALLSKYWSGTKLLVDAIVSTYLDSSTGLLANNSAFWFTAQGYQNAAAPTALFALSLKQLAIVAQALKDTTTASYYTSLYENLSKAINTQLWNPSLGFYATALNDLSETSILATAFTLRAGIANSTQATLSIQSLTSLFYQIGYKDSTSIPNGPTTQLSPNVQGFLLESLFLAYTQYNVSSSIIVSVLKNLLDVYWPKMLNQNQYFTGCPWEYEYPDGSPGIGIFTSLCHPWGGAPTYILSDYVLGLRRELDSATGEYGWVFDPVLELATGLGLTWVNGTVPLMGGGWIEAGWKIDSGGSVSSHVEVVDAQGVSVENKIPDRV